MGKRGLLGALDAVGVAEIDETMPPMEKRHTSGAARALQDQVEVSLKRNAMIENGDLVIEIPPENLEASTIQDRIDDPDDSDYLALRKAIQEEGQLSPILVRPHPSKGPEFFRIVYGHRRWRVARELQMKVRAIVRKMDDAAAAIAQGQENDIRANLSYLEKAVFARNLHQAGYRREVIWQALNVDKAAVSRFLGIFSHVPEDMLKRFGAARDIGRKRWDLLCAILKNPEGQQRAREIMETSGFKQKDGAQCFNYLLYKLQANPDGRATKDVWRAENGAVETEIDPSGANLRLVFKKDDGAEFGRFVQTRLDQLWQEFLNEKVGT